MDRNKKKVEYLKVNKSAGITLIALVVTLVVLLILAGISITVLWGENGILKTTQDAKIQTELGKIEERAQLIYSDKVLENASSILSTKVEISEVISQLISEGYDIEKRAISIEAITGISLDKESITMGKNKTAEIQITYEGVEEPYVYYAEVQGNYYQMYSDKGFITIDRQASNLTEEDFEIEGETNTARLTVTSGDESIVTAILKEESNKIIKITSKEKEEEVTITVTYGSYERTCKIKVKEPVLATDLEINSVRARIAKDYTRWLKAAAIPAEAEQEFKWSSSDESIITVDRKGVVTAKKAGTATITVKTTDGSNLSQECEVTVIENAPDVASLTDFQTKNTVAKDVNGNLITIPGDFKVLTSEGTKVTEGIVIKGKDNNEFVWVPVDSVSTGIEKPADDIRLGRYEDFNTKNANGNYIPKQDADHYTENDESKTIIDTYYQELTSSLGNKAAKDLEDFVTKTKLNGGYYFARYEASKGTDTKVKSQYNKPSWTVIKQIDAATRAQEMYNNSEFVNSDLINSYAWDTAIIFIQNYSNDSNYANKKSVNDKALNTGTTGDEACNIHDMASNCYEMTTEHSDRTKEGAIESRGPCTFRGGFYNTKSSTTKLRYDITTTRCTCYNIFPSSFIFKVTLYLEY